MLYFTVTEDRLDEVVAHVDAGKHYFGDTLNSYFKRELERATNFDHHLVVFFHEGQWKMFDISKEYNVDFVMKHYDFS